MSLHPVGEVQFMVAVPFAQTEVVTPVTLFGVAVWMVCVPLAKAVPDLVPAVS